ncbi:hypothetical protein DFJ58DRAFT_736827 [Suillus subalutaceus]|uniref:uncharacterized protein n=1 Tax=Suillus subalutaceus TaxID=48586 RepID=UPI001B88456D|nr:uncharacterized protein DFJ58DRAFT_736827 [Suillus subalutaceus]KAG1830942.1 hypothetical protein DFJ58DRAFT_736827 [Suillus subalutaceus]
MSVPARPSCRKFTGMQDASEWMEDYSCALDAVGIAIASRHICFSRSLAGTALQWFFDLLYNEKLSWQKLKSAFLTRWSRNFPHTTPAVIVMPLNASYSVYSERSAQDLAREQKAVLIRAGTMVAPIHLYRDRSFQTVSVAAKTYITCGTQTETVNTVSPRPVPTNGMSPAQSFNWADDVDSNCSIHIPHSTNTSIHDNHAIFLFYRAQTPTHGLVFSAVTVGHQINAVGASRSKHSPSLTSNCPR